nr:MAG TPA: hypothetical protein [Caudoviricetes sp.]
MSIIVDFKNNKIFHVLPAFLLQTDPWSTVDGRSNSPTIYTIIITKNSPKIKCLIGNILLNEIIAVLIIKTGFE